MSDDILLCLDGNYEGDLDLTEDGDIQLGGSLEQNAKTAVGLILGEWRLGPELGVPYFEDVFVKKPDLDLVKQDIVSALLEVDGVADASAEITEYNTSERKIRIHFTCTAEDGETAESEVTVSG